MSSLIAFRTVQGFYWLLLGTWLGALVMLAIAAAITFKTVRSYQPTLTQPPYSELTEEISHSDILAGGVVGNVLRGLAVLQIICANGVTLCLVLQCTLFADRLSGGMTGMPNLLRLVLLAVPILCLAIDVSVVSPRVWHYRTIMYNPQATPQERVEARAQFDVYHKLDERVVSTALFSLAAAVFVSAFVLHGTAAAGSGSSPSSSSLKAPSAAPPLRLARTEPPAPPAPVEPPVP